MSANASNGRDTIHGSPDARAGSRLSSLVFVASEAANEGRYQLNKCFVSFRKD